jgi:CRISPR-associated helicase Cas3/CRISPR-associated endonuclease Cas3-HD
LHDLGKYGELFQRRLEGLERGIDHWSAGAWAALTKYRHQGIAAALAIQGHHLGLQQASKNSLARLDPQELTASHPQSLRLSESNVGNLLTALRDDGVNLADPDTLCRSMYEGLQAHPAAAMLDVRMLFSVLVDADFLETEAHFQANPDGTKRYREQGLPLQSAEALETLLTHIEQLAKESKAAAPVNQLRADLLEACLEAAMWPQGLYTLTAPTGAGKTLSMLAFALRHAERHALQRIVAVIPYLTIIEQTARVFRRAFAAFSKATDLERYILEHHSLAGTRARDGAHACQGADMEDEVPRRTQLLAENWDAPIIVTTSVQFLESLLANRPAACRKLHRLANSVILLDEVQTLPVPLAVPTLATLSRLAERYGSTVVFATATQPAFTHLDPAVRQYCIGGWMAREIVPATLGLFRRAKRVEIEWPMSLSQALPWAELADRLADHHQVLCVVNLKRHALMVHGTLRSRDIQGLFHLSTNMCPSHRQAVLQEVRRCLERGEPCRLISTQCVEAGVDVDFPVAYRAFGPLDAIAQVAGRCNRNGRAALGTVHVFLPDEPDEEKCYPDGGYRQAAGVTRILLLKRGSDRMDIHDPELFQEYYRELYDLLRPENRKKELLEAIQRQDFVEAAQLYRIIPKDAINVLVPYNVEAFEVLADEARKEGLSRNWVARARPYSVSLFRPRLDDPIRSSLEPIPIAKGAFSEEWFIYSAQEHYDSMTGLVPPRSLECLIA